MTAKEMDSYMRTRDGWRSMVDRVFYDWDNATKTYTDHQFRITLYNGIIACDQITDYFMAHIDRIIAERWPKRNKRNYSNIEYED